MTHMQFDANLKEYKKVEKDLSKGPAPRWKSRANEQGISLTLNDNSLIGDKSGLVATPRSAKTPLSGSFLDLRKSPKHGFSPAGLNKSPGRLMPKLSVRACGPKSQSGINPKTPNKHGDRFIPNRSTTDLERSHLLLMNSSDMTVKENNLRDDSNMTNIEDEEDLTLKQKEYKERMLENLNDGVPLDSRILSFKASAPVAKDGHVNSLKVLYSAGKPSVTKSVCARHLPSIPEKVLDAPDLLNDYYLHLMDWSLNNHLAVALGSSVFIWNGGDGSITSLAQFEDPVHICSLAWIKEGTVLAVGLSNNNTQLWDVAQQKLIRTMEGQTERVTSLSWNKNILSSGSKSGQIIHHDVTLANHAVHRLNHHTQDICGLKWSPDGRLLASGGNDNLVNIWECSSTTPLHTLTDHQAAVKGLAWCPWQNNLLASGGGTADRSIRLWNCNLGTCLKVVDTNSQVSSLLWSDRYKELVSGHGYSQNQLTLWKYPTFTKIVDLVGHTGRVLDLCLSPDEQTVVSAAADETLRLWKCWAVDKKEMKSKAGRAHPVSALARTIR